MAFRTSPAFNVVTTLLLSFGSLQNPLLSAPLASSPHKFFVRMLSKKSDSQNTNPRAHQRLSPVPCRKLSNLLSDFSSTVHRPPPSSGRLALHPLNPTRCAHYPSLRSGVWPEKKPTVHGVRGIARLGTVQALQIDPLTNKTPCNPVGPYD